MTHQYASPKILIPHSVGEALGMATQEPSAKFWAGGTTFQDSTANRSIMNLPPVLITLSRIEELTRASRSEQALEIGAMMTLNRLAGLGHTTLPPGLQEAITGVATLPVRCRGTLGGHLAYKAHINDLRPLLQILETKVEIRYQEERRGRITPILKSRKIPLAELHDTIHDLHRSILITRISIPAKQWDIGQFIKVPLSARPNQSLIFCAVARIDKSILTEFCMAIADTHAGILRDSELEAFMAGRPLPLSQRESLLLEAGVNRMTPSWENHSFEKQTAMALTKGFFSRAQAYNG